MFKGEADWSLIGAVKANHRITIPIIGNGDIASAEQALAMKEKHRINGIMIGRAAMGNPWIFKQCRALLDNDTISYEPTISERIEVCKKNFLLSVE